MTAKIVLIACPFDDPVKGIETLQRMRQAVQDEGNVPFAPRLVLRSLFAVEEMEQIRILEIAAVERRYIDEVKIHDPLNLTMKELVEAAVDFGYLSDQASITA
jgi:hypothetical protein